MNAEAVLAFFRSLKDAHHGGSEETVLYDEESGKAYRIRATVETVPAYLRQSYSARYGMTGKAYVSWPRRFANRFRHLPGAAA
jgi:hypothetical protein